jgi:hypothetical protein
MQQDFTARPHEWQRRVRLAGFDGGDDVDAGVNRSEVVRQPAYKREGCTRTEADDARAAVDYPVSRDAPEADPLLVALLDPGQFDNALRGCGLAAKRCKAGLLMMAVPAASAERRSRWLDSRAPRQLFPQAAKPLERIRRILFY